MIPLSFLVAANLVLTTRLFCYFRDDPMPRRAWAGKTMIEIGALSACFELGGPLVGAFILVATANLAGFAAENRLKRRNSRRLLIGLLELAGLSICFSPGAGVLFRPVWQELGWRLAEWSTLSPLLMGLFSHGSQLILLGLLLSANEANLAIRAVFDRLNLKPRAQATGTETVDIGEFNRGRVIGLLERALLYGFILQGQYGAIGFILAAKAFARSKALDDRAFAEYVLIGTLLSGGLALCIGLMVAKQLAETG